MLCNYMSCCWLLEYGGSWNFFQLSKTRCVGWGLELKPWPMGEVVSQAEMQPPRYHVIARRTRPF